MINNQELEIKTYHPIDTTSQEHSVLFRFKHNIYESISLFFLLCSIFILLVSLLLYIIFFLQTAEFGTKGKVTHCKTVLV